MPIDSMRQATGGHATRRSRDLLTPYERPAFPNRLVISRQDAFAMKRRPLGSRVRSTCPRPSYQRRNPFREAHRRPALESLPPTGPLLNLLVVGSNYVGLGSNYVG